MFDHPEAHLGDYRDRLEELRPWLDLDRFDRRAVNQALTGLAHIRQEDGMKISVHIAVGAGDDTPTVLGEAGQLVAELRCATPLTSNVDVMLPMSHITLRLANGIRQALRRLEFLLLSRSAAHAY